MLRSESQAQKDYHREVNAIFACAKQHWRWFFWVQTTVALLSVVLLLVPSISDKIKAVGALVILGCQILAWTLIERSNKEKTEAELATRLLHIWFGLGYSPADSYSSPPPSRNASSSKIVPYEFQTRYHEGIPVFLEVLNANAIYLETLYSKCAIVLGRVLYGAAAFIAVASFSLLVFDPKMSVSSVPGETLNAEFARMIVIVISFVLATNAVSIVQSWKDSANRLKALREKLGIFLRKDDKLQANAIDSEVLNYIIDFYQALGKAPLIPWGIHQKERQALVDDWQSKVSQG